MLSDIKKSYVECASQIEGWETMNKNDLANLYLDNIDNPVLKEAYFSTLVLRYWGNINKFYSQFYNSVTVEQCYDWLINGLLYALGHARWRDADTSVYGDPNGPDKVINRCILCEKQAYFQFTNMKKRKANFATSSVEALQEELGDAALPQSNDDIHEETEVKLYEDLIAKCFDEKKYFAAFLLDRIINFDVFDKKVDEHKITHIILSKRKLIKLIHNPDESYKQYFLDRYGVNENTYDKVAKWCRELSYQNTGINRTLKLLAKGKIINCFGDTDVT